MRPYLITNVLISNYEKMHLFLLTRNSVLIYCPLITRVAFHKVSNYIIVIL